MAEDYAIYTWVCKACKGNQTSCQYQTVVTGDLSSPKCPFGLLECQFMMTDVEWVKNPNEIFRQGRSELYKRASDLWGFQLQMDLVIEEMAELTEAIIKSRRNNSGITYAIKEELVDVEIMCEHLREIIESFPAGKEHLREIRKIKLSRLERRVKAGEEKGSPITPLAEAFEYDNFSQEDNHD